MEQTTEHRAAETVQSDGAHRSMQAKHLLQAVQPRTALWIGLAAGLATLALFSAKPAARNLRNLRRSRQSRRLADYGTERRNPLHFFLAGNHPRRRHLDRSGTRPLFERRQSVYESY